MNESDVAEITCSGYGNPTPVVTWSVNGRVLTNDSRVTVIRGNLSIRNVRRNDTGVYTCVVKNYLRKKEYSVHLTVQGGLFYKFYKFDLNLRKIRCILAVRLYVYLGCIQLI